MQVPTHNQGFEILRRNLFSYNKAFCQLIRNQNPNEALHPQIVRDFIRDLTTIDQILGNSDIEWYLDPESNGWDYVLHSHVTRPLEGFEEIPTQQFWNCIIDARWRQIWKRKNPWFEAWRELMFTYELDAERSPRVTFAAFTLWLDQYQRHFYPLVTAGKEEPADDEVVPPQPHGDSIQLPANTLVAFAHVARRLLREHCQARICSAHPY
jgi:hypothetical protein